ncbi:hypothetical protein XC55_04600, partial [Clostridioides difficile]
TISKEPSGRYYVSLCCTDVDIEVFENTNNQIGLDLGIKELRTSGVPVVLPRAWLGSYVRNG